MPSDSLSQHNDESSQIRTFNVTCDSADSVLKIRIATPDVKADNLPLETWASSTVLASQLHHLPIQFPAENEVGSLTAGATTLPVVELGAGTGVVGITAATVWKQPAILTDLPPIVPALEANIALNKDLIGDGHVAAGILDWTADSTLTIPSISITYDVARTKAHVLIAADTLYSSDHPELLSGTVERWLNRHADARLVLGTAMRVAYLEELRELWSRLEGIGLECIWEKQEEAEEGLFDDERLVECSLWRWRAHHLVT